MLMEVIGNKEFERVKDVVWMVGRKGIILDIECFWVCFVALNGLEDIIGACLWFIFRGSDEEGR